MHHHNAKIAVAGQPRRLHKAGVAPDIGFGARDPHIERKIDDRGRDDDVGHRIAQGGHDTHRQHEQRKRHDGVGDASDDAVGPPAEEAGGDPGEAAHHQHQRHRSDGDHKIEACRHQHTAEDVAAQQIGTEPMVQRRRLQGRRGVAGERIVWRNVRADQGAKRDDDEQPERQAGHRIFRHHITGMAENGVGRRLGLNLGRRSGGQTGFAHASSLTRGSITL